VETKVKYLVDTNVWLERLLDQDKSEVTSKFLDLIPIDKIFISDFATHSIGVILSRLKKFDVLERFIVDLFINGQIEQLSLDGENILDVVSNMQKFRLDFDDSYQYTVALKYDLIVVTFDKDFNLKGIRKNSPDEIIGKI
jgi:predicted nucleic acid-binding protein